MRRVIQQLLESEYGVAKGMFLIKKSISVKTQREKIHTFKNEKHIGIYIIVTE